MSRKRKFQGWAGEGGARAQPHDNSASCKHGNKEALKPEARGPRQEGYQAVDDS